MEQIGKNGRRDRGPDQAVSFKDLDGALAKTLEFRVKKPAIRPPKAIGLESALQHVRLKKNTKTRQCPLLDRC